jgi:hypothetical protein
MPAEWWNCNNKAIYDPPFLIKVLTIALDPVAVVMKPIINEIDPDLLTKVENGGTLEQVNFALYAGLWDGMIGLIGGIGDGVKMVTMNLATANEDAKKESAKMSKLISDNGGGIGGFGRLMWDGIKSGFDTKQPCVFAHTVGEFTFGIILGVLTGGEALASTAVGKAIKKWVVICDKLDVIGQAVSKTAGCVLKISYQAGKPVFHVLYEGVKVIPKFFEAPVSGKLYSFIIPLPQVNLKGGIEAFKEAIAKGEVKVERVLDEADNVIVDEEGNILNKAITKEGEEVELLEKVDIKSDGLLTRLNNASFKVLKGKFDELDDVLKQKFLSDFDEVPDQILYKLQDEDLVDAWRKLIDAPETIRKSVNHLSTVRKWTNEGIALSFEAIEDGAKILNKNGNELGKLLKEGAEDVLEISDDFIVDVASSASKKFDGIIIKSNTGETFINAGFVKNADGTLGFVEDVSSYGSQLVQNTIKQRGALRKSMSGIKTTEDAHHIIPVQLLKENEVVKKAVEAGFEFNSTKNGLAIEKFVKKTGTGRHGPHPEYTKQINQALTNFAKDNPGYTAKDAKELLEVIINGNSSYKGLKRVINESSEKINYLTLNIPF